MNADLLVENFFRHEYGKLVSILSCRVGAQYLEDIEDAVQNALLAALETWTRAGPPENPSAWLFRVARNQLLEGFRTRSGRQRILDENTTEIAPTPDDLGPEVFLDGEIEDDLLRTLFYCCDEAIPTESRLVLALKSLCGFNVSEISLRLFISEANVYKRLGRARKRFRESRLSPDDLTSENYKPRLPSVRKTLYLLFTEGYLSSHMEHAIRKELCDEAIRLTTILADHPAGQDPETYALLALMHLHSARFTARQDATGGLLLLEEQDRSRWNRHEIQLGLFWLAKSADGEQFSRYHAEAGIAAEHCVAPSFEETRWERIVGCYELLERVAPSPLHQLNKAIAIAEWKGADKGIAELEGIEPPTWLEGSYLWNAAMADLHRRVGDREKSAHHRAIALESAPTKHIRDLIERRLAG